MNWKGLLSFHLFFQLLTFPGFTQSPGIQSENGTRAIAPWHRSSPSASPFQTKMGEAAQYYWAAFSSTPDAILKEEVASLGAEWIGFAGKSEGTVLYKVRIKENHEAAQSYLRGKPGFLNLLPVLARYGAG